MRATETDLRDAFAQSSTGPHPEADVLARAAAGELGETDRERVAAHVEVCGTCAQQYRVAFGVLEPVSTRVDGNLRLVSSSVWRRPAVPYAMAASLALFASALLAYNVSLRRDIADLQSRVDLALAETQSANDSRSAPPVQSEVVKETPAAPAQPHLNVPIVDLVPGTVTRGAGARRQTLTIAPGSELVALILNTTARRYDEYALAIARDDGTAVWQGRGLRHDRDGTLSVVLPTTLLPPGEYRVKLSGVTGNGEQLVHEYPITVPR